MPVNRMIGARGKGEGVIIAQQTLRFPPAVSANTSSGQNFKCSKGYSIHQSGANSHKS